MLDTLFPALVVNVASYLEYARQVRNKMAAPLVVAILSKGVSVVLLIFHGERGSHQRA